MHEPRRLTVHLALISVSVLFGVNYVFTKWILDDVSPKAWVFFRVLAATAILVPLGLWRGRTRPDLRQWGWLALASLLGVVLNQLLFTEGIALTTPEHSAVINAGIPTWTLLIAVVAGQERLSAQRVLAIALALCGVQVLLRFDQVLLGGGLPSGPQLAGDLLTLANGLSFALHLVLMRRIGSRTDPWTNTAVMFTVASVVTGLWCLPSITAQDVAAVTSPPLLWLALYAVLFATVFTYLLNTWALRHAPGSQVALYINVQPLVAASLGIALGGPLPDWRFAAALLLVGGGLLLQTRR